jgi:hypothetical protein
MAIYKNLHYFWKYSLRFLVYKEVQGLIMKLQLFEVLGQSSVRVQDKAEKVVSNSRMLWDGM